LVELDFDNGTPQLDEKISQKNESDEKGIFISSGVYSTLNNNRKAEIHGPSLINLSKQYENASDGEKSIDEEFLEKVEISIIKNLGNEVYGADDLAKDVGFSRSQVHRKLSSLKGESITNLIRTTRLNHALYLLKKKTGTVSEISFQVGFNSPSYFTKCFHEHFGYPPGEVSKNDELPDKIDAEGSQSNYEEKVYKLVLDASVKKKPPISKRKVLLASIGIALAILAGWWIYTTFNKADSAISKALIDSRIAILPYENNTNDTELDVLGEMAADWITSGLMNFEELKVVSFQNVKDQIEFASLGNWEIFSKQTGADKIIKGRYYQQGEQLIFQTHIIDAASGDIEFVLPEIRGSKSNVEKIVNDLKQRIMGFLAVSTDDSGYISRDMLNRPPKFDAYQSFISAIKYIGTNRPEERKLLTKTIVLDSSFFEAYRRLIISYFNDGDLEKADSIFQLIDHKFDKLTSYQILWHDWVREVVYGNPHTRLVAIKKIYKKDPWHLNTNYNTGLNLIHLNRPREGIKVFEQIDYSSYRFTFKKNDHRIKWHTYALIRMNRLDEAREVLNYLPKEYYSPSTYYLKIYLYILMGQKDSIPQVITRMEEDNLPWNQIIWHYWDTSLLYKLSGDKESQLKWANLFLERIKDQSKFTDTGPGFRASANYLAEQYEEALPLYQELAKTQLSNWGLLSRIGIIHSKMNNREAAEDMIQELKTNDKPTRKGRYKYVIARIYAALNEKELAVEYLKQAFVEGFIFIIFDRYDFDPELIPLHGYPPYEEFVRPKG